MSRKMIVILKFAIVAAIIGVGESKLASIKNKARSNNDDHYTVIIKDVEDPDIQSYYKKYVPEGCYGQKQLRDILRNNHSKISYKPRKPVWCREDGLLIPPEYTKGSKTKQLDPDEEEYEDEAGSEIKAEAPYKIDVYPFTKTAGFRVVIKSVGDNTKFTGAVLAAKAKAIDKEKQIRGRFILSRSEENEIKVVCCSYFDKNVALYNSTSSEGTHQVIFYWTPEENAAKDFEGLFLFQATIADGPNKYWPNVISKIYNASRIDSD